MLSLLRNMKPIRVMSAQAASTTVAKSNGVNCTGLDTVLFIAEIGVIASGGTCEMKLQGSVDDVDGDYVDLYNGTTQCKKTILDGDDGKLMCLEVVRPQYQWLRYVLTPAVANVTIDGGIVLCGVHQRSLPADRDTTSSHYGHTSYISPTHA